MANFSVAYLLLSKVEFGDNPQKFLHVNQGEDGWTIGGIYQLYNKDVIDWKFIREVLEVCGYDAERAEVCEYEVERASVMLYADTLIKQSVFNYFRKEYWDKILLDEVKDQSKANNIFLSGVHIGIRNAVKLAQKVVQVQQDGFIGQYTLKALNNYHEQLFKTHFDKLEIDNYNSLIKRNPNLAWAQNGFLNRAYAV